MDLIREVKLEQFFLINDSFLQTKSDITRKVYIKYINDFFKTQKIEEITLDQVKSVSISDAQQYQNYLLEEGFQPESINTQITAICHLYDFLIENNLVSFNPFSKSQALPNVKKIKTVILDSLLEIQISSWPEDSIKKINDLRQLIAQDNNKEVWIGFWNLLRYFPNWKDKSKKKVALFLELLEKFNIGLEPDYRFTRIIPEMKFDVVLFLLDDYKQKATYSPAYAFASLNIKLGAMVSKVDGIVVEEEVALLKNQIVKWPGLNALEKKRLELYLEWLLRRPLDKKVTSNYIRSLGIEERHLVGDLLLKVSQADGIVRPEETRLMNKLYLIMNLDTNKINKDTDVGNVKPITQKASKYAETNNPSAVELLDFLLDYID